MSLKSKIHQQQFALKLPRDLGNGLVLRLTTPDDAESLAQFSGRVFGRDNKIDEIAMLYTRDMMRELHPIIGPANTFIVEDTRTPGKIVSTMCLIPQTWTYAGIPFGVGRPEMVATDPDYRRRGLVRAQFEVVHALSESLGHLMQGITGIHWYYRQFEYEYALDLGGGRIAYFSNVPTLKENESEPFRVRAATFDDIPFLSAVYDRECARSLVACPRSPELWRYQLEPQSAAMAWRAPYHIIETNDGRAVGYVQASRDIWLDAIVLSELAVAEGQSMRAVMPSILRWAKTVGESEAIKQEKTVKGIYLSLGREHPAYDAIPDLLPRTRIPYGWYIRVPAVPQFIRHIAPALEKRLAQSVMAGHTGELKISEYRRGCKIVFENGKLTNVEAWQPMPSDEGDCGFPPLVFLQLLFCRKSLLELREAFADVWAKDDAAPLLDALFPKTLSCVYCVS